MQRILTGLIAATALTVPAIAGAQTINERQANLFARIDAGVQNRQLTPREANDLKSEFNVIARLEADYRASAPGLTDAERGELNKRFDALSSRIQTERRDAARIDFQPINQRQAALFNRIDVGVKNGRLTQAEANRLKAEFQEIARVEARYRQDGLTRAEVSELETRLDGLSRQIHDERTDAQRRG